MLIDSHCHLDRLDLTPFNGQFSDFMAEVKQENIEKLVCISITLEAYPAMCQLVSDHDSVFVTVGVHPTEQEGAEPSIDILTEYGQQDRVIGIGETGLDYFRCEGDMTWQQERFRTHIRAAKQLNKPLIVHTRNAKEDTLRILKEESAEEVGGVLHCFTEDWDMAKSALDLNFYISFSGIVTFKNAQQVHEVARKIPEDRFLIETDAPYLAPVPYRGKPNYPLYLKHVADRMAELKGLSVNKIADLSTQNFYQLFPLAT